MVDLISSLTRLDASAFVALLLVTLLAALKYIGQGIVSRLDAIEKTIQEHTTSLAVIKSQIGHIEDDIEQQ